MRKLLLQMLKETRKKSAYKKTYRSRQYDEKFPFELDFKEWIGSTAKRYEDKRKSAYNEIWSEINLITKSMETRGEPCTDSTDSDAAELQEYRRPTEEIIFQA